MTIEKANKDFENLTKANGFKATGEITPETFHAYGNFITALCDMAKNQKRVTAKEKPVDNDKYAFRCFLLRLGFIGDEFKTARDYYLRNMEGNCAWRHAQ